MINIYEVACKNLLRKKIRSVLTILGIALSAWVLVSLLGFNRGYETALNKDIDNMGFQVLVTAKGCPYEAATLMLKGGTGLRYMDQSVIDSIVEHPEVEKVTPMLMQAIFDPNKGESGGITAYLGVDPSTYPQMKAFLKFQQGGWFRIPTDSTRSWVMKRQSWNRGRWGTSSSFPKKISSSRWSAFSHAPERRMTGRFSCPSEPCKAFSARKMN